MLCPEDADREDISTDSQANPQLNLDNSTIIKKRDNIAKEILDSERRYVESLLLLQNVSAMNSLFLALWAGRPHLLAVILESSISRGWYAKRDLTQESDPEHFLGTGRHRERQHRPYEEA